MEKLTTLNWKIVAKAGEGVMASAKLFAKALKRHGWSAFTYYEYPSLIKGGLQSGQVYASAAAGAATCQRRLTDVLIVFHEKLLTDCLGQIGPETVVLLNANRFEASKFPELSVPVLPVNLGKIARTLGANPLAANIAALGVSAYVYGMDLGVIARVIADEFANKPAVVKQNLEVFKAAYEAAVTAQLPVLGQIAVAPDQQLLVSGAEAVGLGALAAGVQFYSAYPMTPSTGLLHFLAAQQDHYPIVVKHAEDEIAAINHALGASFAGVRAMTGSSGGGFALMVESLSFAGVAELPLVVLEAMRQGPATGLPTWTSQGDLNFVLTAGHGDFLRVVLTPGSVAEHFALSKLALELAEKYQLPVLILSDKFILESLQTIPQLETTQQNQRLSLVAEGRLGESGLAEGSYLRYADTPNGISPRAIPGQTHTLQLTNSYEHDQYGFAVEDAAVTKQAVDKRARKLASLVQELPPPVYLGAAQPKHLLVSFGSTVNVLEELLRQPKAQQVGVIHLPCVWPFPTAEFERLVEATGVSTFTVLEGNSTGQLAGLIRRETKYRDFASYLRYDGRPFYVEDLMEHFSL